jgi:hypothetical protein
MSCILRTNTDSQETEAYTTLGINTPAGALYFFNRMSPLEAAHENWNVPRDKVQKTWLPDLASSSDHAWGFWTREHPGVGHVADIRKIFTCMITNEVTIALINEALRTYPLPPGTDPGIGLGEWRSGPGRRLRCIMMLRRFCLVC